MAGPVILGRLLAGAGGLAKDAAQLGAATFMSNHGGLIGQAATMKLLGHQWKDIGKTMAVGIAYQTFGRSGVVGDLIMLGIMANLTRQNLKGIEDEIKKVEVTRIDPKTETKDILGIIQKIDKKHVESANQIRQTMQKTNTFFFKKTEEHTKGFERAKKQFIQHQQHLDRLDKRIQELTKLAHLTGAQKQSTPLQQSVYNQNQITHKSPVIDAEFEEIGVIRQLTGGGSSKGAHKMLPSPQTMSKFRENITKEIFEKPMQMGGGSLQMLQGFIGKLVGGLPLAILGAVAGTIGGAIAGGIAGGRGRGGGDLPKQVDWTPDYFNLRVTSNIHIESRKDIVIRGRNVTIRADDTLRLIGRNIIGVPGTAGTGGGGSGSGLNTTHTPGKIGSGVGQGMIGEPDNRSRFQAMQDRIFKRQPGAAPDTSVPGTSTPGSTPTPQGHLPSPRIGGSQYNIPGYTPQPSFPEGPMTPGKSLQRGNSPFSGIGTPSTPSIDYGQGSQVPGFMGRQPVMPGTQGGIGFQTPTMQTGPLTGNESGKIDPVAFYHRMKEKVANDPKVLGHVPEWGPKVGITTGSAHEWARFWTMTQQQESGHRQAKVNPDGSLARFPTTPAGEQSYGPGQFKPGEYGLKTWADVNNPEKVMDAYLNTVKKGKTHAYFGSLQRPHEITQHGAWFDKLDISNQQAPIMKMAPHEPSSWGRNVDFGQSTPKSLLPEGVQPSAGPWRNFHGGPDQQAPSPFSLQKDLSERAPEKGLGDKVPSATKVLSGTNYTEKYPSNTERFFHSAGNIQGVDPRLIQSMREASKDLPAGYRVQMISGKDSRNTGTTNHPSGIAADVVIYDDKGRALTNLGGQTYQGSHSHPATNEGSFGMYEKYYHSIRERVKKDYPDETLLWGGGFTSGAKNDKMHYQFLRRGLAGSSQGSGAYNPITGLDPRYQDHAPDKSNMSPDQIKEYQALVRKRMQDTTKSDEIAKAQRKSDLYNRYRKETGQQPSLPGMTGKETETSAYKAWESKQLPPGVSLEGDGLRVPGQPDATRSDSPTISTGNPDTRFYKDGSVGNRIIEEQRDILNRARDTSESPRPWEPGKNPDETKSLPGIIEGTNHPMDKVPYANPFHSDSKIPDITAIPKEEGSLKDVNPLFQQFTTWEQRREEIYKKERIQEQAKAEGIAAARRIESLAKGWRPGERPSDKLEIRAKEPTSKELSAWREKEGKQFGKDVRDSIARMRADPEGYSNIMDSHEKQAKSITKNDLRFSPSKNPSTDDLKPPESTYEEKKEDENITKPSSEELNKRIDRRIETSDAKDDAADIKDPRHNPEEAPAGVADNGYGKSRQGNLPNASD